MYGLFDRYFEVRRLPPILPFVRQHVILQFPVFEFWRYRDPRDLDDAGQSVDDADAGRDGAGKSLLSRQAQKFREISPQNVVLLDGAAADSNLVRFETEYRMTSILRT